MPLSVDELAGAKVFTSEDYEKYLTACRLVLRQLELMPGEHAVIVNGRVSLVHAYIYSAPISLLTNMYLGGAVGRWADQAWGVRRGRL